MRKAGTWFVMPEAVLAVWSEQALPQNAMLLLFNFLVGRQDRLKWPGPK